MFKKSKKSMANPVVVLREEFDDWAILFHPDTNDAYGIDPVSVFIWKHLDGNHTETDILEKLRKNCENVPKNAKKYISNFIKDLVSFGLAGYESEALQ